jgi:hypothetical protein
VRCPTPPPGLDSWFTGGPALDAARRVGIYHHAYFARQVGVLAEVFPRVRALLGDEAFSSVGRRYLELFPSRTPVIERIGEHFADFLSQSLDRERSELVGVARLEWARLEALLSPDAASTVSLESLSTSPPDTTRLIPHPAARLLLVSRRALELWHDAPTADRADAAAWILVARPALTVLQRELDDESGRALSRSLAGDSLAAVFSEFSGLNGVERASRALALFLHLGAWSGLEVTPC